MAQKNYYRITERKLKNGIKHYIYIDDSVKATEQDLRDIEMYMRIGYILKHKSQERAEKARERAKAIGFGKKKKAEAE